MFIFVRRNSANTAAPVDQSKNIIHRSDKSSISHQDLAAMKRMVQELSQNPELLRQQCNIPQLSQTMSTRYQEWMDASSAAAAASCQDQLSSDDDENFLSSPRASSYDNTSATSCFPTTPPPFIKERVPLTPQTQDTMLMLSHDVSSQKSQHYGNRTQSFVAPYSNIASFCQECNSLQVQPPPLSLHMQDSFRPSSAGAISSMPFEFTSRARGA